MTHVTTRRLGDMASDHARAHFAGRARELAAMASLFDAGGPVVVHVNGVAGIGKSTLLDAFAARARAAGAAVVRIDCRAVEPTPRGFLAEISDALGEPIERVEDLAESLSSLGERVVVTLDTYEVFRLLDSWIRMSFVASLPENSRVLIASRNPPSAAWRTAPGWTNLFRSMQLDALSDDDALAFLARAGVANDAAKKINAFVRGHPLALSMAASLAHSAGSHQVPLEDAALHEVIDNLSRAYLGTVDDADTRMLLEATSVVRCATEPLLRALAPAIPPRDAMDRLRALPFAEFSREGLFIHDAVRSAIAASLATRDPDAYREHRRAAWSFLRERLGRATPADMWRTTADSFFLLSNPVLREGFFPSGPQPLAVEPALAHDDAPLRAIALLHSPVESAAHDAWWRHHQDGFHVVKDEAGDVRGYYVMVAASDLHDAVVAVDPIAAEWRRDLAARAPAGALFCRRLFDRDVGERPCPVQAACWVDIKRTYLEMRARLRWVYMTLRDPRPFADVAMKLGFRPTTTPQVEIGTDVLFSFVLDMGPGGVDGWLAEMVGADVAAPAREFGDETGSLLDVAAQELVLPSGRIGLTTIEFGVIKYLSERCGKAVSRYDLLEAVWGHRNPNSSNVVDVVIRALRKKLGSRARTIETVRGTGYRYRPPR